MNPIDLPESASGPDAAPRLILIGHGMVGHRLLEELAREAHGYAITVLCAEPHLAYDRVRLSQCFDGADAQDLALADEAFFRTHGITVLRNTPAAWIDRKRRRVHLSDTQFFAYDKLVIATGSNPFIPPIEGADRPGCLPYRTLEDVAAIRECAAGSRSGVVIGGGLLGLEAARALRGLGLDTHVVEFSPHLMAAQLDAPGGRLLRTKIEALGIHVHTGKMTSAIGDGLRSRHRLRFSDGDFLETDMVVFSAGIRPCDRLAHNCGLVIGERGGIVIDAHCRSSDPAVYAIGEVASWQGATFGLVAPGYDMARVCAAHLLGRDNPVFQGSLPSTKLKLLGVDVGSIGDAHGRTPDSVSCVFEDTLAGTYRKLVMDPQGKRLRGAVLVGDTSAFGLLDQYFSNGLDLPAQPAALIAPPASATPALGVDALPDNAQICSCNQVSKGALCRAIADGCTALGELKSRTRAGTTCGGCIPLVKQVLESELQRQGIAVDRSLCEHFPYSRQELYHLIRVHGIRDFKTLIARHGKGKGCDLCKPTAASIFASCWNEYVLAPQHAPLQDSNDAYLGNLQKDGTYSVVPRIPGGELLASDLDDDTLIRMIDRFLMLYIRTADRLQRTAAWRESLEGGLDYLKDVIVNDSLGLGAELEAQMQALVDAYECEWAATLKDEQALRRFRPLINSDAPDEHIVHVRERGQPRPATPLERAALAAPVE